MPKGDGGFEIRPTVDGEALVTRVPGGRLVSNAALWRATPAKWCATDEGWWHDLYVAFGDDPREYFAGQAWRGTVEEFISRRSYDDMFGFDLRSRLFPVADISPCRCRYSSDRRCRCGHQLDSNGFCAAEEEVWRALYGPDSV
ncbi:hypothetical protein ACIRPK_23745 [Kitasatospora sp. NPDC101801]|uniref:hypothetical protein n=1 Tax=Kitasatospora sp. NPDC101801 TaxID=3364103 RepID=UPI0037F194F2